MRSIKHSTILKSKSWLNSPVLLQYHVAECVKGGRSRTFQQRYTYAPFDHYSVLYRKLTYSLKRRAHADKASGTNASAAKYGTFEMARHHRSQMSTEMCKVRHYNSVKTLLVLRSESEIKQADSHVKELVSWRWIFCKARIKIFKKVEHEVFS